MRKLYGPEHVPLVKDMLAHGVSKIVICARFGWKPWTLNRLMQAHLKDFMPEGNCLLFANKYYVYNDGRVWSCHMKQFLRGEIDRDGYLVYGSLQIQKLESKAHRLVLKLFDRYPLPGEESRHLDGVSTNNHINNLRWGTGSQNQRDRIKHGRHHWAKNYVPLH